jgi:hypothetical protein
MQQQQQHAGQYLFSKGKSYTAAATAVIYGAQSDTFMAQ